MLARRFPLTSELADKGVTEEQWAEICTSLRSGKGMTGLGGGFSLAIAEANAHFFDKLDLVACYAECTQHLSTDSHPLKLTETRSLPSLV